MERSCRERLNAKEEEIEKLRKKVEEENQCTEDQLMTIREEVKWVLNGIEKVGNLTLSGLN